MFGFSRPCHAARSTASRIRLTLPDGPLPGRQPTAIEHQVPAIVQRILDHFQGLNGDPARAGRHADVIEPAAAAPAPARATAT
jgi:hypothetical protein